MWEDLQPRQYGGNRGSGRAQVIGLQRHMPIAWVEWNMREDVICIFFASDHYCLTPSAAVL